MKVLQRSQMPHWWTVVQTTDIINDRSKFSKFDVDKFAPEKHYIELAEGARSNIVALKSSSLIGRRHYLASGITVKVTLSSKKNDILRIITSLFSPAQPHTCHLITLVLGCFFQLFTTFILTTTTETILFKPFYGL